MSRNRHIRKAIFIGIIDEIIINKKDLCSFYVKLQPRWIGEDGQSKQGREIFIETTLEDEETIQKYSNKIKAGTVVFVEGELKNHHWQEGDIKKKRLGVYINKFEGSLNFIELKKDSEIPYLNKVFIVGNVYKINVRNTKTASANSLMGIFSIVTKKSWRDKETSEIVDSTEWLDVFSFDEKSFYNMDFGETLFSGKMCIIEASMKNGKDLSDKRITISVTKRSDNKLILIDMVKQSNNEGGSNSGQQQKKESSSSYSGTSKYKAMQESQEIDEDEIPF